MKGIRLASIVPAVLGIMLLGSVLPGCADKQKTEEDHFSILAGINPLSPDNGEKPIVKQMNEAMGVTIDWNSVTIDMLGERKNLAFATGDLPDAFMGAGLSDYELISYGNDGTLIRLNSYINAQTMPNLTKVLEDRPGAWAAVTMPDGGIYTLPAISEIGFQYTDGNVYQIGSIPQFTAINTAWLEKLGLKMPETIDEFHDVLAAFKTRDPNGNGKADEIPLTFRFDHWCGGMGSFFSAFGFTDYNADHRVLLGDTVLYNASREEYRDAIRYFSQWFKEGLIDVEVFSQDDSQYIAKGNATEEIVGSFVWWEIPEFVGQNRASHYTYLNFLSGKNGQINVNLNESGTMGRGSFAVTKACTDPAKLLKWVDQLYEPKMSMQAVYGPIGVFFSSEPDANGVYQNKKPPEGTTYGELKAMNELLGPTAQLGEHYGTLYYMEDRAQQRLTDLRDFWFKRVRNFEYYPTVTYSQEEIEILNNKLPDIKNYTSEMGAKWLLNGGIDGQWDEYLVRLKQMGLDEVLHVWQAAYDRYTVNLLRSMK